MIKNFKSSLLDRQNEMEIETIWESKIHPIVSRVASYARDKNTGFYSIQESIGIYTYLYDLTAIRRNLEHNHLDFFFQKEMDTVRSFCASLRLESLSDLLSNDDAFTVILKWFLCFFRHLNRLYVISIGERRSIEMIMRTAFRDEFMDRNRVRLESLLTSVWLERRDSELDSTLIRAMHVMVKNDPDCQGRMESLFVEESDRYYQRLYHDLMPRTIPDYVAAVLAILEREEKWIGEYFNESVWENARAGLVRTFIMSRYHEILMDPLCGWKAVLVSANDRAITNMSIFLGFSTEWMAVYREYLHEQDPGERVLEFYETHDRYLRDGILCTDTASSKSFYDILHSEIRLFFQNHDDLVERMARIIDGLLRKKAALTEIVRHLRVVDLCHDKNLFQDHYRSHLQRRLLEGVFDMDQERECIQILREKMGISYVIGMTSMVDQMCDSFLQADGIHLSILSDVLFGGGPRLPALSILPSSIRDTIVRLQRDWSLMRDTRVNFSPSAIHGQVVLDALYPNRSRFELQMNPLQASLVLWIQEKGPISISSFESVCDDRVCLQALFGGMDRRILRRRADTLWEINPDFSPRARRIRLPPLSSLPTKSNTSSEKTDSYEMDTIVDAYIVRLLKNRKTIRHQDLLQHLHRFQVPVPCLKSRIESLIEREYIARGPQSDIYSYL